MVRVWTPGGLLALCGGPPGWAGSQTLYATPTHGVKTGIKQLTPSTRYSSHTPDKGNNPPPCFGALQARTSNGPPPRYSGGETDQTRDRQERGRDQPDSAFPRPRTLAHGPLTPVRRPLEVVAGVPPVVVTYGRVEWVLVGRPPTRGNRPSRRARRRTRRRRRGGVPPCIRSVPRRRDSFGGVGVAAPIVGCRGCGGLPGVPGSS